MMKANVEEVMLLDDSSGGMAVLSPEWEAPSVKPMKKERELRGRSYGGKLGGDVVF